MRKLFDRKELIADIDLVDGVLKVNSFTCPWVRELMEEMRGDMTDTELWDSLPQRLRGHVWIGERVDE